MARKPQAGTAGPKSDWQTRVASLKDVWKVLLLFGVVPITVCEIGMIMPPVGINLFRG